MKRRYILFAISVLMATIATTAQTLTITTGSGSQHFQASDITSSSPITFSNSGMQMFVGGYTYTVNDIVKALISCENNGYVKQTCSVCGGDTHCTTCHGTGIGCTVCNGTGKYCTKCGGSGKHDVCQGTERASIVAVVVVQVLTNTAMGLEGAHIATMASAPDARGAVIILVTHVAVPVIAGCVVVMDRI